MKPLNIIHLSTARSWRGGENQLFLLARGVLEHGHRTLVVAPGGSPLIERCREAGIPVQELTIGGGADVFGAWKLGGLLRKESPDVLHVHDGHAVLPAKWALMLAGARGKKIKLIAHRRTVFKIKGRSKYKGRVDCVIAISHAAKQTLLDAGVAAEKIRVVYSGMEFPETLAADGSEVRSFRGQYKIPDSAFVVAHAAALTSEKRQGDMLEALAKANARLGELGVAVDVRLHLVLAGTGELEGKLRDQATILGLEKQVTFAGFLKDLRPLWAVAKIAFFASEAEGLCTALVEAQGAGLPALVTRAGGMAEVVEDGASGVIVEVGNVNQMVDALIVLHQEPARRLKFAERARVRARGLFSSTAMVAGVLGVYTEVVSE